MNLTPIREELAFAQGDNPQFEYTFNDADTGNPLDFTGASIVLTVSSSRSGAGSFEFALTPTNALDTTGVVVLEPTTAEMGLAPGVYHFDLQWTNAAGKVRTLLRGPFTIEGDIS